MEEKIAGGVGLKQLLFQERPVLAAGPARVEQCLVGERGHHIFGLAKETESDGSTNVADALGLLLEQGDKALTDLVDARVRARNRQGCRQSRVNRIKLLDDRFQTHELAAELTELHEQHGIF